MAKQRKGKRAAAAADPKKTITIALPDQLSSLKQDQLIDLARLIFGDTAKFDVKNIVFVDQSRLSGPAQTDLRAQMVAQSGCP